MSKQQNPFTLPGRPGILLGCEKNRKKSRFLTNISLYIYIFIHQNGIWETIQDRAILTMEDEWAFRAAVGLLCSLFIVLFCSPIDLFFSNKTRKYGPCRQDVSPSFKIALPVTLHVVWLTSKFECWTVFCFPVNGGHGSDGQTDGQGLTRNAAFHGGPHSDDDDGDGGGGGGGDDNDDNHKQQRMHIRFGDVIRYYVI